ncbi:hypothetical protein [Alteromonas sp. CYL-A6]
MNVARRNRTGYQWRVAGMTPQTVGEFVNMKAEPVGLPLTAW